MQLQIDFSKARFDGDTYDHSRDGPRLGNQMNRVYSLMIDGHWRTLQEISALTESPESSVSARIRDLRKPRFGGYQIERAYVKQGLFRYRLVK